LDFKLPDERRPGNPAKAEEIQRDQFEVITYLSNLRQRFLFYDLAFRFNYEIAGDYSIPFFGDLALFYLTESQASDLWGDIVLSDGQILKHVKDWGPVALRSSLFFDRCQEWMSDNRIAGKKLNLLKNALVEYAYHKPHKDACWKQGRSERDVLRKYGTTWIEEMYRDLTAIFKLARRKMKGAKAPDIYEIIEESFVEYFYTQMNRYKADKGNRRAQELFGRIFQALEYHRTSESDNPIALIIESDETLKDDFSSFDKAGGKNREPNILAKRTIAKLFGVSESKITKIIEK
jgi:hypothetical protein